MKKVKIIGYIATLLSFIFIIRVFSSMDIDKSYFQHPLKLGIKIIILALVLSAGYFLAGYAWRLILEFLSKKVFKTLPVIDVYIRSNIVKYLPGNIMHFAGRNLLGKALGINQLCIATSTGIEIALLVITALILIVTFSFNSFKIILTIILKNRLYMNVLIITLIGSFILLLTVTFYLVHKKKFYTLKMYITSDLLKVLIKIVPIYLWNHVINALVFICIFKFILNVDIDFMLLGSACLLSWVIGYIIPGAPGGIGVREMILIVLLTNKYSENIVLMGPIFFRLVGIVSDVLAYLINSVIMRNKSI